ncbi:uncharacterized protein LOC132681968 isoform X1 [Panthera onca]
MLCKMSLRNMLSRSSVGRRVTGPPSRTDMKEVTLLGTFAFHFVFFRQVPFLSLLLALLVGKIPDKGISLRSSLLCGTTEDDFGQFKKGNLSGTQHINWKAETQACIAMSHEAASPDEAEIEMSHQHDQLDDVEERHSLPDLNPQGKKG